MVLFPIKEQSELRTELTIDRDLDPRRLACRRPSGRRGYGNFIFGRQLSQSLADEVDFDQRIMREPGDTDAGAGWQPIEREIAAIPRKLLWTRIKLTAERDIEPFAWMHPDEDR